MNRKDIKFIQEWLSVLINQPIRTVSRGGGSIFISFGELIEKDAWNRDKEGKKINERKIFTGKYALHIECNSRFTCGDQVVMAKYDVYQPTSEQEKKEDFDWDNFDWDIKGGNRYDELSSKYFSTDSPEFIVNKILVNRLGDLKIKFTNDFVLEVIIDTSDNHECWRFFEVHSECNHLVISGQGIEEM